MNRRVPELEEGGFLKRAEERPGLARMLSVFVLAAMAFAFGAMGQMPRSVVWVLEMHDGLTHLGQASELKEQIRAAKSGGARLVCIELSGQDWRIDVAEAVGEVLAKSEPPAVVFVRAEKGNAGLGLLVAGSRANAGCYVESGAMLVASEGMNKNELAPDAKAIKLAETKWKKEDERSSLKEFGALRGAIFEPGVGVWVSFGKDGQAAAFPGEPDSVERALGRIVVLAKKRDTEVRLAGEEAASMGLCSGSVEDARGASEKALDPTGVKKAEMRERRAVGPSLGERREEALEILKTAERAIEAAEVPLKLDVERLQIAPNQQHAAAALARTQLDEASRAIADVERLFRGTPEVMRLPAPGQSDTGQRAATFETRWRQQLQKLKDRFAKTEARAEKFAKA